MPTVLITGVSGFVGRALCANIVPGGWHVKGAVRGVKDSSGFPSDVELVEIASIGPDTDWAKALNGVDVIIHLAARVHVMRDSASDPLAAFRQVNVTGTERLAREAAAAGVRRFVLISSVKVNGEGKAKPYTEQDELAPEDPYGVSKREAEQVMQRVAMETGLELVILRPPLVYGPGVKANFFRLLGVVQRGIPLPLAQVDNYRSLLYLGNLVDAIITCINHPNAAGQTFLVSDGEDVSTPELIRLVAVALGQPVRLVPFPLSLMRLLGTLTGKSSAVDRLLGSLTVDISKIRRELGWTPPYTMAQGLKATADWYIQRLNG